MVKIWLTLAVIGCVGLGSSVSADCVDINADPAERLVAIAHINDERAEQLIAGRPWPSVGSLTGINGIGRGRIRDIVEQDLACVGVRAPRGERETIEGVANVLDADTFDVAGERVRLIRIDSPEGEQLCQSVPMSTRSTSSATMRACSAGKSSSHSESSCCRAARVDIGTDWLNVRLRVDGLGGLAREMLAGGIGEAV